MSGELPECVTLAAFETEVRFAELSSTVSVAIRAAKAGERVVVIVNGAVQVPEPLYAPGNEQHVVESQRGVAVVGADAWSELQMTKVLTDAGAFVNPELLRAAVNIADDLTAALKSRFLSRCRELDAS